MIHFVIRKKSDQTVVQEFIFGPSIMRRYRGLDESGRQSWREKYEPGDATLEFVESDDEAAADVIANKIATGTASLPGVQTYLSNRDGLS